MPNIELTYSGAGARLRRLRGREDRIGSRLRAISQSLFELERKRSGLEAQRMQREARIERDQATMRSARKHQLQAALSDARAGGANGQQLGRLSASYLEGPDVLEDDG